MDLKFTPNNNKRLIHQEQSGRPPIAWSAAQQKRPRDLRRQANNRRIISQERAALLAAKELSPALGVAEMTDNKQLDQVLAASCTIGAAVHTTANTTTTTIITRGGSSKGRKFAARLSRSSGRPVGALRLSAWATLLALIALLSSTRWFGAEAIKLQPDGVEKFYWTGEQFVITCQNNNNIKNAKIRWYGPDDQEITEDQRRRVYTEQSGNHGHRLLVHNATAPTDEGRYRCTVAMRDEPRVAREAIEFRLKLYRETSFTDTPDKVVLVAGTRGSLKCHVQFDPSVSTASVTWARGRDRDKKRIEVFNDTSYQVKEYDPREQVSELLVNPVNKRHDDWYTCSASAITDKLSRIMDKPIKLETHYAPQFDSASQTVWIERPEVAPSVNGRASAAHRLPNSGPSGGRRHPQQPQQQYPQPGRPMRPGAAQPQQPAGELELQQQQQPQAHEPQIVTVELRCSVEANPVASIIWSSSGVNLALTRGQPPHVVDERQDTQGHNTTAVLVIEYNLAANWPHKHDTYTCSASNSLGAATKRFNIEQSDPPPAFSVGPLKSYNPQSKLFEFALFGPIWGSANQADRQQNEIVPPVDSFRIRAASAGSELPPAQRRLGQGDPSVQFNLFGEPMEHSHGSSSSSSSSSSSLSHTNRNLPKLNLPQNFTVNLSRLPSGQQRLFLEAHNAVGWSPNATYLGDYYIVSAASTATAIRLMGAAGAILLISVLSSILMSLDRRTPATFAH